MINRRGFLHSAAAGAVGSLAFHRLTTAAAARKLNRIGLQLYTVRSEMAKDFPGALQKVAAAGYHEVEFAGYYNRTPQQVKELLQQNKLTAPAVHVPLKDLGENLGKAIDAAKVIGHRLIVCPYLEPKDRQSLDDYKRHAVTFNKAAEACKKAGLEFAYHNHDFEFLNLDGQMPFDLLLAETDPKLVKIELDLYWIKKGKQDAFAYFAKHPGRFVAFHVKDMDKTEKEFFTEAGRGQIDFKSIFAKSQQAGVKYYFVEQDQTPGSPFDSIKISFDYLKGLEF